MPLHRDGKQDRKAYINDESEPLPTSKPKVHVSGPSSFAPSPADANREMVETTTRVTLVGAPLSKPRWGPKADKTAVNSQYHFGAKPRWGPNAESVEQNPAEPNGQAAYSEGSSALEDATGFPTLSQYALRRGGRGGGELRQGGGRRPSSSYSNSTGAIS